MLFGVVYKHTKACDREEVKLMGNYMGEMRAILRDTHFLETNQMQKERQTHRHIHTTISFSHCSTRVHYPQKLNIYRAIYRNKSTNISGVSVSV